VVALSAMLVAVVVKGTNVIVAIFVVVEVIILVAIEGLFYYRILPDCFLKFTYFSFFFPLFLILNLDW